MKISSIGQKIWFLVVLFALATIRIIPEIQIGKMPIGFDTATSYVAAYESFSSPFIQSLKTFDFLYYLFSLAHNYLKLDSFIAIKTFSVLIFLLFNTSFFLIVRDVLKFKKLSAVSMLVFGLQLVVLRISWDLLRNEFGLSLAMLAIWQFSKFWQNKKWFNFLDSLLLTVLSLGTHQMVAFIFLTFVFVSIFYYFFKHKFKQKLLGQFILVLLIIFWPFLVRLISYQHLNLWVTNYTNFDQSLPYSLFYLCFFYVLPFAILGLIKKPIFELNILIIMLLIQSFSINFFKVEGFYLWDRWMYFLIIPIALYMVIGLEWLSSIIIKKIRCNQALIFMLFSLVILFPSISFLLPEVGFDYKDNIENYFPKSIVWNSMGRPDYADLKKSAIVLNTTYDYSSDIYADYIYAGALCYYSPNIQKSITFVYPDTKDIITQGYIFGNSGRITTKYKVKVIYGSSAEYPVYYF